jgi:predicted phosphoribosyltransferase
MTTFADRREAGRLLAHHLEHLRNEDPVVLALPRGGVPIGYEVARHLGAPLDVLVVRKLGVPGHEELAMGAIASGGVHALNDDVISMLRIPKSTITRVISEEERELMRRELVFRGNRSMVPIEGKSAILVDDGLATGASMRAAAIGLRQLGPRRIVAAVPVGPPETCAALARHVDEMICLAKPPLFFGVGQWYRDFAQTSDQEVRELLADPRVRGGLDVHP